jgi:hypothetical protein
MRIWKNEQAKLKVTPTEVRLISLVEPASEQVITLSAYMKGELHEAVEAAFSEDILIESLALAQQMIERS